MSLQRALLRSLSTPVIGPIGRALMQNRHWTVESGVGAGLLLTLPQNRDYVLGSSELPVQAALERWLRPNDVFYDIGANVGFFSLIAARCVGHDGRVLAFEPVAENAAAVRKNAALNGFEQVSVLQLALGDRVGNAEMLLTPWDGGGSLSHEAVKPGEATSSRQVPITTLDAFVSSHDVPLPTFVKVDVEGFEGEVLRGMSRTIAKHHPVLLYEIDDGDRARLEQRWQALDQTVTSSGYRIERLASSYPNRGWFVGHSLALPLAAEGTS